MFTGFRITCYTENDGIVGCSDGKLALIDLWMEVPDKVAMGTVIGPMAATVAPSLIKLVITPVIRLVETSSPVLAFKMSGRILTKPEASQRAAPEAARP